MLDGNRSILINTNGKFNLCHRDIDKTEYVGDIYSSPESWNINLANEKKKFYNDAHCNNCIFYPTCFTPVICTVAGSCSIRKLQYRERRFRKELSYILKHYVLSEKSKLNKEEDN
jgi:radical SAM protein with 4Fe4S-binding SPASM domain